MKYFRSYPWGIQLLWFLMLVGTMVLFGVFLVYTLLPRFTGYDLTQIVNINEHSPFTLIRASLVVQGITSLFIFLVPAWLFAYLAHPRPNQYIGLRAPGKAIQPVLAILVVLGAMPVLQVLENLIGQINFGAKIKADQAANESLMNAFLTMPNFSAFLLTFTVIAIIPAIGEEMMFRGILLRFTKKRSRTMTVPIIFTSIIFSYSHANIYGYLSIFLAGVLLAVIYYLTSSLWCNILAHLFFNGSQVILMYLSNTNATVRSFMTNNTVPVYYVIAGAVLFAISFYLLLKNKTPLPANWTDDFSANEISGEGFSA